ncbi:MAG TPA: metallophosphoesterase [Gemmatimonadales bacterium]|nr:metallophosphoesterase [Gemmatimonadales bacterium]
MTSNLSRRQLLVRAAGITAASGLGALGYAVGWEPEWLEVVERDLPIVGLPVALEGRTLVQLSDLHIGPRVDSSYIAKTFATVAAMQPDIVVVTGDWITYRGPAQLDELARLLEQFPRGRLASLGILGNHDYGFKWRMPEVADTVTMHAKAHGIQMLRNEAVVVEGLTVIGLEDLWGPSFEPPPGLLAESSDPRLALCHNPDAADWPVWEGYQGWILAGHTHGGQCKPPFLEPPILPVNNPRYAAGEVAIRGGRQLYISRGVGYLLRARFNVRPEVTKFRLTRAAG